MIARGVGLAALLLVAASAAAPSAGADEQRLTAFLFTAQLAPAYARKLSSLAPGKSVTVDNLEAEARQQTPLAAMRSGVDTLATLRYAAGDVALRRASLVFVHSRSDARASIARVATSFPNTRFVLHSPRPMDSPLPNVATYALDLGDAAYLAGMLAASAKRTCPLGLIGEDQPATEKTYRDAFAEGARSVRAAAATKVEILQDPNPQVRAQALDRMVKAGVCVAFVRGEPFDEATLARHPRLAVIAWDEGGAIQAGGAATIGRVTLDLAPYFGERIASARTGWSNTHAKIGAREGVYGVQADWSHFRQGSAEAIQRRLREMARADGQRRS